MATPDPSSNGQAVPDEPDDQALLLTVEEAARRLRIGRTTMYALISDRAVESVTIGTLRRIPAECLAAYVTALRAARQPETAAA
jgi:excisionase family DNA binding protein